MAVNCDFSKVDISVLVFDCVALQFGEGKWSIPECMDTCFSCTQQRIGKEKARNESI